MKRFFCILLCLLTVFTACGCQSSTKGDVAFYYCRNDYVYGEETGVIRAEARNVPGYNGDLTYLLSLYLVGPMDETLYSPIPSDIRLLSVSIQEDTVEVSLSDFPSDMTEANISLAFSCLALTCLEITGVQQVTISSGSRTDTLSCGSILLFDDVTIIPVTEETQ